MRKFILLYMKIFISAEVWPEEPVVEVQNDLPAFFYQKEEVVDEDVYTAVHKGEEATLGFQPQTTLPNCHQSQINLNGDQFKKIELSSKQIKHCRTTMCNKCGVFVVNDSEINWKKMHCLRHLSKEYGITTYLKCLLCEQTFRLKISSIKNHLKAKHGIQCPSKEYYDDGSSYYPVEIDKLMKECFSDKVTTKTFGRRKMTKTFGDCKKMKVQCLICFAEIDNEACKKRMHVLRHVQKETHIKWIFRCLVCSKYSTYTAMRYNNLKHHLKYTHFNSEIKNGIHYENRKAEASPVIKDMMRVCFQDQKPYYKNDKPAAKVCNVENLFKCLHCETKYPILSLIKFHLQSKHKIETPIENEDYDVELEQCLNKLDDPTCFEINCVKGNLSLISGDRQQACCESQFPSFPKGATQTVVQQAILTPILPQCQPEATSISATFTPSQKLFQRCDTATATILAQLLLKPVSILHSTTDAIDQSNVQNQGKQFSLVDIETRQVESQNETNLPTSEKDKNSLPSSNSRRKAKCLKCSKEVPCGAKEKRSHVMTHIQKETDVSWMYQCLLCPKFGKIFQTMYYSSFRTHFRNIHPNVLNPINGIDYINRSSEFSTLVESMIQKCFEFQIPSSKNAATSSSSALDPENSKKISNTCVSKPLFKQATSVRSTAAVLNINNNIPVTEPVLISQRSEEKIEVTFDSRLQPLLKPKFTNISTIVDMESNKICLDGHREHSLFAESVDLKKNAQNSVHCFSNTMNTKVVKCAKCYKEILYTMWHMKHHVLHHVKLETGMKWIYKCLLCTEDNVHSMQYQLLMQHFRSKHKNSYPVNGCNYVSRETEVSLFIKKMDETCFKDQIPYYSRDCKEGTKKLAKRSYSYVVPSSKKCLKCGIVVRNATRYAQLTHARTHVNFKVRNDVTVECLLCIEKNNSTVLKSLKNIKRHLSTDHNVNLSTAVDGVHYLDRRFKFREALNVELEKCFNYHVTPLNKSFAKHSQYVVCIVCNEKCQNVLLTLKRHVVQHVSREHKVRNQFSCLLCAPKKKVYSCFWYSEMFRHVRHYHSIVHPKIDVHYLSKIDKFKQEIMKDTFQKCFPSMYQRGICCLWE